MSTPTGDPLTRDDVVLRALPLGFPWQTQDPFLFCVHHLDFYPKGNEAMGPAASLAGRRIGMDFEIKDGWRMYHGDVVPGFPSHPHRGFETITVARQGYIDHSDSLGAKARFGGGDCQWMTAGKGIVHAEMFPLRDREKPNTCELFQIWINLPRADKMVDPYFTMLWSEKIPVVTLKEGGGPPTMLTIYAGQYGKQGPPPPPPNSWAARKESEVAVWTIKMAPGAAFVLPATGKDTNRTLYFFEGDTVRVGAHVQRGPAGLTLRPGDPIPIENGPKESELLFLQGRPIGEPVAQRGPFVMNTQGELRQAFVDYQRTRFGGWPWNSEDPVHGREEGRFAIHADGRKEVAG